ncbi:helix-turn-helix domain-containing protein, partial [Turicibacter sanguinis]|nr:helix-turn-helix domain-containing protein [Turicibacter sanguinis]
MFLTVGQKLKKYRKLFNIKLSMFERYGFSAAYISYIENNKRIPPFETAKEIFEALVCLTNGEIVKQITVEDFVKDEYEEAESWVIVNCNLDMALNNYKQYYEVCNKYNLNNYLIKLDEILAYYYQSIKKYFISN